MRARDYHMWWQASHIGLGHPLESGNYSEIVETLSPAGAAVAIVIHMLPTESSCEKDHMVNDLKPERAERWSAALRHVGADRLARFVESSVGVEHVARATSTIPSAEYMQLVNQGLSFLDAWKAAARRYYEPMDVETHAELEALADQFAEQHDAELSADIARFGDRRPTTEEERQSFQDDWLDAVHAKHERQREEERAIHLESQVDEWDRDHRDVEKMLQTQAPSKAALQELVGRLAAAHRELASYDVDRLGPRALEFKPRLAALIDRHRDVFPDDVRPDAAEVRHARVLADVSSLFTPRDAACLASLGNFASVKAQPFDPLMFGSEGDVDLDQRSIQIRFSHLQGMDWGWAEPTVDLVMGPVQVPAAVSEELRDVFTGIVQRKSKYGERLAAALLSDFRDRFLPVLSTPPGRIYRPDVTDDDVLADVESASMTILWVPTIQPAPRIVFSFDVLWDSEHGVCLEELPDGTFELSEL